MTLSQISEAPDHRIRMSELAYLTNGSLSRLSNVVKRLEYRGWVTRSPDPGDGRYTLAALTDAGHEVLVTAAPVHVRSVRELVLDPSRKPTGRPSPASRPSSAPARPTTATNSPDGRAGPQRDSEPLPGRGAPR
jgi:hypothetical protein